MVSAWPSENRLMLASVKVDDKINVISSLSELLMSLAIAGYIVTIDAFRCKLDIISSVSLNREPTTSLP